MTNREKFKQNLDAQEVSLDREKLWSRISDRPDRKRRPLLFFWLGAMAIAAMVMAVIILTPFSDSTDIPEETLATSGQSHKNTPEQTQDKQQLTPLSQESQTTPTGLSSGPTSESIVSQTQTRPINKPQDVASADEATAHSTSSHLKNIEPDTHKSSNSTDLQASDSKLNSLTQTSAVDPSPVYTDAPDGNNSVQDRSVLALTRLPSKTTLLPVQGLDLSKLTLNNSVREIHAHRDLAKSKRPRILLSYGTGMDHLGLTMNRNPDRELLPEITELNTGQRVSGWNISSSLLWKLSKSWSLNISGRYNYYQNEFTSERERRELNLDEGLVRTISEQGTYRNQYARISASVGIQKELNIGRLQVAPGVHLGYLMSMNIDGDFIDPDTRAITAFEDDVQLDRAFIGYGLNVHYPIHERFGIHLGYYGHTRQTARTNGGAIRHGLHAHHIQAGISLRL